MFFKGQKSNDRLGLYSDSKSSYIPCGEECPKCHNGECSKQLGHTTGIVGHQSTSGKKHCGHSWN